MPATLFPSDPDMIAPLTEDPVGIWNYDADTSAAMDAVPIYSSNAVTFTCTDCHLAVTEATLYVSVELDTRTGFSEVSVWGDFEMELSLDLLLKLMSTDETESTKELIPMTGVYGLYYANAIRPSGVAFDLGLKAGVDQVINLDISALDNSGTLVTTATWGTVIAARSQFGFTYTDEAGTKLLSSSTISNTPRPLVLDLASSAVITAGFRPRLELGAFAGVGFAEGQVMAHSAIDLRAVLTLSQDAAFVPGTQPATFDAAPLKLEEITSAGEDGVVGCNSAPHNVRVLLEYGTAKSSYGVNWYAAAGWPGNHLKSYIWQEEMGPWRLRSLEKMYSALSGCLCLRCDSSDDSSPAVPSSSTPSNSLPSGSPTGSAPTAASPSSVEPAMPSSGVFVEGAVSLNGMSLYQWTSTAELGFRRTVADSAGVDVTSVEVTGVSQSRRRLMAGLSVNYRMHARSSARASVMASSLQSELETGGFLVKLHQEGLDDVEEITVLEAAEVTTVDEEAAGDNAAMVYAGVGAAGGILAAISVCLVLRCRRRSRGKKVEAEIPETVPGYPVVSEDAP